MAPITKLFISFLLTSAVISAPLRVRQLAGEGAAADSILTDTDNGVGYGIENAEDNTASLITSAKSSAPATGGTTTGGSSNPAPPPKKGGKKRQLAGEGAAADSILTDTDNGVGYGTENAEDNAASLITSAKGSAPATPKKRQADKIANGASAICTSAGVDCSQQTGAVDTIDGATTSGAANTGAAVGSTEEATLEAAGSSVPSKVPRKRQADKIVNGAGAVLDSAGANSVASTVVPIGDNADGTLTSGAANAGAEVGSTEESTLEGAGSSVPSKVPRKMRV